MGHMTSFSRMLDPEDLTFVRYKKLNIYISHNEIPQEHAIGKGIRSIIPHLKLSTVLQRRGVRFVAGEVLTLSHHQVNKHIKPTSR